MKKRRTLINCIHTAVALVWIGSICAVDSQSYVPLIICIASTIYLMIVAQSHNWFNR